MSLLLVGLSHSSAPVAIRERYAVAPAQLDGLNEKLAQGSMIEEVAILSTCNRTELLAVASGPADAAEEWLHAFLRREIGDGSATARHVYTKWDGEAVMHLLRVAVGLDSMVLGEPQILGQVKAAYQAGVAARSVGPILNRLFQRTFKAAKRVRRETGLGASSVTVARVGVRLARAVFESLEGKAALMIGAGAMAESALLGLQEAGVEQVVVMSRTAESAERLAERFGARPATLETLRTELAAADVALSSLQVERPVIGVADLVEPLRERQGRPLLLVDLGVPRNVDPAANDIENLYLYDLDDLEGVAAQGRTLREASVDPAVRILERERDQFESWLVGLELVPTVRELISHAQAQAQIEVERAAERLGEDSVVQRQVLERLAEGILSKLLHGPLERLRAESEAGSGAYYGEALRRLFGLDVEEDDE